MSYFDTLVSTGIAAIHGVFGETATYTPQAGGAPKAITVTWAQTVPQVVVMDEHGQQSDRIGAIIVNVADVPTPSRGDLYALTSAARAGTWIATKIEKGNSIRWLVSLRLQSHDAIAGKGALEVRP